MFYFCTIKLFSRPSTLPCYCMQCLWYFIRSHNFSITQYGLSQKQFCGNTLRIVFAVFKSGSGGRKPNVWFWEMTVLIHIKFYLKKKSTNNVEIVTNFSFISQLNDFLLLNGVCLKKISFMLDASEIYYVTFLLGLAKKK